MDNNASVVITEGDGSAKRIVPVGGATGGSGAIRPHPGNSGEVWIGDEDVTGEDDGFPLGGGFSIDFNNFSSLYFVAAVGDFVHVLLSTD